MKKFIKALTLGVATAVLGGAAAFSAACTKLQTNFLKGKTDAYNTAPVQEAYYEDLSAAAIAEWKADGAKAPETAGKLWALACYNERYLEKFCYFLDQDGTTKVGGGDSHAIKQEYYLRWNETSDHCGYRYHYTIKEVESMTGILAGLKSAFEDATLRVSVDTNVFYRYRGDDKDIKMGEDGILTVDWHEGEDWGKVEEDNKMVKSEEIPTLEGIEEDIGESVIGKDNNNNVTIHGNINTLAENIVKSAEITENTDGSYSVTMVIDNEVANADEASLKMLRNANSSGDCKWKADGDDTGLKIDFTVWANGLMKEYTIDESWKGKISGFSGSVDSVTVVKYSYADSDTDVTEIVKWNNKNVKDAGDITWFYTLTKLEKTLFIVGLTVGPVLVAGVTLMCVFIPRAKKKKKLKAAAAENSAETTEEVEEVEAVEEMPQSPDKKDGSEE